MGVREIRYCDISGTEAHVQSHELQVDQMRIEIDLADREYSKLLELLRPYLDAGRVEASVPDLSRVGRTVRKAPPSGTALTAEQRQEVRDWAEAQGIEVPANNRFKRSLVERWKAATSPGAEPGSGDPGLFGDDEDDEISVEV